MNVLETSYLAQFEYRDKVRKAAEKNRLARSIPDSRRPQAPRTVAKLR